MADLGKKLKDLRKKNKLSIYDVERLTGLHFSTISKYERNERKPSLGVLRELAEVYNVSIGGLLSEQEELLRYLPPHLQEGARLLLERQDLLDLLALAQGLRPAQVQMLTRFLKTVLDNQPAPDGQQ